MKTSVKTKLILTVLISVTLAAAAFAFISYASAKRAAETVSRTLIDRTAVSAAENLSGKIAAITAVSDDLSDNDAAFNRATDKIRLLLLELRNKSYNADGVKFDIAYADELRSIDGVTDYSDSEAVKSAASGRPLMSAPECTGGKNYVCYASPLDESYGGRKCVLICTAECGFFDDVFDGVSLGDSCAVYVADENGVIAGEASGDEGIYTASAPIDERRGWTLYVEASPEELMPDLSKETAASVGVSAALAAVLCAVITAVLNGTLGPIKKLTKRMSALAEGDFTSPVPQVRSRDESYEIACALEKTTAALNGCVKEITESVSKIAEGDISEDKAVFAGDFAMIHGAVSDMKKKLRGFLLQIKQTGDAVIADAEKLEETASEYVPVTAGDGSAEKLLDGCPRITEYAEKAAKKLDETRAMLEKEKERLDGLAAAVAGINDYADEINDVISQIDDISFQTNILALNAAVEASAAGEYGRSFAVVADEVRALAQKSSEAAKSTAELIGSTLSSVSGGAALARESSMAIDEISSGTASAAELIAEARSAAEEYEKAARAAEETVSRLAEQAAARNSSADAEKAKAIAAQANRLRGIADSFKT